jgi:hypothetical protein
MPTPPRSNKYSLIIDRVVCSEDKTTCETKNLCIEWTLNDKNQWTKVAEFPLKSCDGYFAVSSDTEAATRKFLRDLYGWSKSHCSE